MASFLKFLVPALNATVGFWATVSLNIPDFTRFARSQRQQMIGQALALPTTMTLYSLIGILVTSATVVIYGTAIWDPVQLLSRFHSPVAVVISLLAILLATLNVNIGANVVSPANDFSNLWPRKISFRTGGVITCFMGIAMMPWKLLGNYKTMIFGWLGGYAAFLGPVAGIMICDYFVIRRRVLWSTTSTCAAALTNIREASTGWRCCAGGGCGNSACGVGGSFAADAL